MGQRLGHGQPSNMTVARLAGKFTPTVEVQYGAVIAG
jgi:hypothetical protein